MTAPAAARNGPSRRRGPVAAARAGRPAARAPSALPRATVTDGAGAGSGAADLLERARAGDGEAFGLLYDRYRPMVYRYVYYRVGSTALAEDIVSETFLRALRGISRFTWQGRDLGAWLVTIARHLIVDHLRSSRFRLERPTDDIVGASPALLVDGPEDLVIDVMTNEVVLEALRGLRPEQRECLVLRFLEGMSVRETASAMGKNEGAVKALQHRAVRSLARRLPAEAREAG